MSLRGKVVLVLANSEGALPEQARKCAQLGAIVVVHIRTAASKTSRTRTTACETTSLPYTSNLRSMSDVENLLNEVSRTHGKIDLVLDAAGNIVRGAETGRGTKAPEGLLAYAIFVHIQQALTSEHYREESRRVLLGRV